MIWIDYVIVIIIAVSVLISFIRGFIYEILSLIIYCCSFFISIKFYSYITKYIFFLKERLIKNVVAIVILFITILTAGAIVRYLVTFLSKKNGLSNIDRIFGICFGLLRGISIIACLLFFFDIFVPFLKIKAINDSKFIPYFNFIIKLIFDQIKYILNVLY